MPITIHELFLSNFRGIRKMQLQLDPRVNVLTGINGCGKSSILEALALALSRLTGRVKSLSSNGLPIEVKDIRNDAPGTVIQVQMTANKEDITWQIAKERKPMGQAVSNLQALNQWIQRCLEAAATDKQQFFPVIIYYGVSRNVLDIPLRIRGEDIFNPLSVYTDALSNHRSKNDFRLFFEWFRDREDLENEKYREQPPVVNQAGEMTSTPRPGEPQRTHFDVQLKAVCHAIEQLLPGFSNLRIHRNPLQMLVTKSLPGDGRLDLDIKQLSDGEKCLLAMVGDLARRMAVAYPEMAQPLEADAIVLIDELDLHLHPQWQREILPRLTSVFPNSQFIVTTHSPLVVSRLEPKNIFLMAADEQGQIQAHYPEVSKGLSVNEILGELMQEEHVRDEKTELLLKKIEQALANEDISASEAGIVELKQYLQEANAGLLPELTGLETELALLKAQGEPS